MTVEEPRQAMLALADGVAADEMLASHFARLAGLMDDRGEPELVMVFWSNVHRCRVEAIMRRAKLGALIERYGDIDLET